MSDKLNLILFVKSLVLYFSISVKTMSDKRIYKNQFLIPLARIVLFILHTEKSSHLNIIVIDYFAKPLGIHDDNLLSESINHFLFLNIL